jgi:hypothetical protein
VPIGLPGREASLAIGLLLEKSDLLGTIGFKGIIETVVAAGAMRSPKIARGRPPPLPAPPHMEGSSDDMDAVWRRGNTEPPDGHRLSPLTPVPMPQPLSAKSFGPFIDSAEDMTRLDEAENDVPRSKGRIRNTPIPPGSGSYIVQPRAPIYDAPNSSASRRRPAVIVESYGSGKKERHSRYYPDPRVVVERGGERPRYSVHGTTPEVIIESGGRKERRKEYNARPEVVTECNGPRTRQKAYPASREVVIESSGERTRRKSYDPRPEVIIESAAEKVRRKDYNAGAEVIIETGGVDKRRPQSYPLRSQSVSTEDSNRSRADYYHSGRPEAMNAIKKALVESSDRHHSEGETSDSDIPSIMRRTSMEASSAVGYGQTTSVLGDNKPSVAADATQLQRAHVSIRLARRTARELGPPPSTRGFDKINRSPQAYGMAASEPSTEVSRDTYELPCAVAGCSKMFQGVDDLMRHERDGHPELSFAPEPPKMYGNLDNTAVPIAPEMGTSAPPSANGRSSRARSRGDSRLETTPGHPDVTKTHYQLPPSNVAMMRFRLRAKEDEIERPIATDTHLWLDAATRSSGTHSGEKLDLGTLHKEAEKNKKMISALHVAADHVMRGFHSPTVSGTEESELNSPAVDTRSGHTPTTGNIAYEQPFDVLHPTSPEPSVVEPLSKSGKILKDLVLPDTGNIHIPSDGNEDVEMLHQLTAPHSLTNSEFLETSLTCSVDGCVAQFTGRFRRGNRARYVMRVLCLCETDIDFVQCADTNAICTTTCKVTSVPLVVKAIGEWMLD